MKEAKTTKEIFERLYQRELTNSEVADMQFNLYGFFKKLYEIGWQRARAPPYLDLLIVLHYTTDNLHSVCKRKHLNNPEGKR